MIEDFFKDPSKVSGWLMALAALAALIRGNLIPRWMYDEVKAREAKTEERCIKLEKDRDDLQNMLLRSTQLNDRLAGVAEKAT